VIGYGAIPLAKIDEGVRRLGASFPPFRGRGSRQGAVLKKASARRARP
jgi:hypothetical protein